MPPDEARSPRGDAPRGASSARGLLVGRILAAVGLIVFIPAGLFLVSVAVEALGMVLGVVGYFLGARGLGALTVVLGLAAMVYGLLTQGYPVGPGV